jgi:hypothetical protein
MLESEVVAAEQLRYANQIYLIKKILDRIGLVPATDIRIYPDYPNGWHATVGAYSYVYVFSYDRGDISLTIEDRRGFYPNGCLIRKSDPKSFSEMMHTYGIAKDIIDEYNLEMNMYDGQGFDICNINYGF